MQAFLHARTLRLVLLLALLAAAFSTLSPEARALESGDPQVDSALEWLVNQQVDNGGFAAFGDESDPGTTADVIFALAAAGSDPATVTSATDRSPVDYLIDAAQAESLTPGVAGKIALALLAAGNNLEDVDGTNLLALIQSGFDPESGLYDQGVANQSYAILALAAAGAEIEPDAIAALQEIQIEDGAWSFTGDVTPGSGDSNSTAIAVQALVAAGGDTDAIEAGVDYILSLQDDTGAIAYDASEAPEITGDANSTALAIQALVAAGRDATQQVAALEAFQNESGAFFWRSDFPDDSLLATAQAIPAILQAPLPLDAVSPTWEPGTAGLVIRHGDGSVVYMLVDVDDDSMTGMDMLTRSGIDAAVAPFGGLGGAVCSLDGEGCPSDDCFCESYSDPAQFWNYFIHTEDGWKLHPLGPESRSLSNGDIDGWSWTGSEEPPPAVSMEDIVEIVGQHGVGTAVLVEEPGAEPIPLEDRDTESDTGPSPYLLFAGMAVLVVILGVVIVRSRTALR